jgi:hypothetical protein
MPAIVRELRRVLDEASIGLEPVGDGVSVAAFRIDTSLTRGVDSETARKPSPSLRPSSGSRFQLAADLIADR